MPHSTLIGDKAFCDPLLEAMLNRQQTTLHTPRKKPKGAELRADEKYYNRLISRLRQPIESFFNWLIDKTDIQRAGRVRSTDALMVHCFGKLTFAFYLWVIPNKRHKCLIAFSVSDNVFSRLGQFIASHKIPCFGGKFWEVNFTAKGSYFNI